MSTQDNRPEQLPVHPEIEKRASKDAIEALCNMLTQPATQVDDALVAQVKELLQTAVEVFGEDEFIEPLNYLASSRHGLRETDLVALMGEDWDKDQFFAQAACFGRPLAVAQQGVAFIYSQPLKAILMSMLSPEDRKSFQEDIAYHLLAQPENDPVRAGEVLFHLMQAGRTQEAADHFGKAQGMMLQDGANLIGSCFVSGEEGQALISDILNYEGEQRFDLYRHFINEVFASLLQNTPVENPEKLMKMIDTKLQSVMGERNTIDNIELYALTGMRIASIHLIKNEIEEVTRRFNHAISLIDSLMAQNPPAEAFTRKNIDIIFNMGMICIEMKQPKAAEHLFDIAFGIIDNKIKTEENPFESKLYLASWYVTVCRVFMQVGDKELFGKYFAKGKKALQEALRLKGEMAAKNPAILPMQHDLMVMYTDFGDLLHAAEADDDAVAAYSNALAISERLAESHKDEVAIAILPSISNEHLGRLYRDKRDLKKAGEAFAKALELRKALAKKHEGDIRLLHDLATANNNMASLYADAEDKSPAEEYLVGQLDALAKVNQIQPNEQSVANVLDAIISLGDYYYVLEKYQEALHTYEQALQVIQPLLGRQVSEHLLNRIAGIHYKAGMSQIELKAQEEGRKNLTIASQLWKQLHDATKNEVYKNQMDKAQEILNKYN